jgi:MoaA/NifB/PqqE/SkfB family radical SAM enzyme
MIIPKISLSLFPFVHKPYLVMFNITEKCNLRCRYCFGQYYDQKTQLTLPQIKKILLDFYALGARRLALSGGEPLLYKDIDQVIKFASSLGFSIGINSNGILVPKHLKALKLLGNLSISLDGENAKIHDYYRGKGSFDKAIAGIEAAHKAKIPLHFCLTLNSKNINHWPKVLKLAKKYKAKVLISPLYPQFSPSNKNAQDKSWQKQLRKTLQNLALENNSCLFYTKETYKLLSKWPDFKKDISSKKIKGYPACVAGKKMVFLDSSGNLFACQRLSSINLGLNCFKLGVKKSYTLLPSPSCSSCSWACYLEYNSLLGFKPKALLNFLKK